MGPKNLEKTIRETHEIEKSYRFQLSAEPGQKHLTSRSKWTFNLVNSSERSF